MVLRPQEGCEAPRLVVPPNGIPRLLPLLVGEVGVGVVSIGQGAEVEMGAVTGGLDMGALGNLFGGGR